MNALGAAPSVPIRMGWRDVCFGSWSVDPEVVAAHLPESLTVDTYDGDAWLTVVPYVNVRVRPRGMPEALGVRLPELNLRTYVRSGDAAGVYFFNLDADGAASVLGARTTHHLPYYNAEMTVTRRGDRIDFESERRHPGARPCRFSATYGPTGDRLAVEPDTLAHFLTERYRLFTEDQRGRLRYAGVSHEPWQLYEADVTVDRNDLFVANGFDEPESDPVWYYSPGVETETTESRLVADGTGALAGGPNAPE
jgi:uncharacterized protein YqjF (DUF2071 family)